MSQLWWVPLGLGALAAVTAGVGMRRLERRLEALRLATAAVDRVRATASLHGDRPQGGG